MKNSWFMGLLTMPLMLVACNADHTADGDNANASSINFNVTTTDATTRAGGSTVAKTDFIAEGSTFRIWAWMNDGTGSYRMTSDFNSTPLYDVPVVCHNGTWAPDVATYGTFYWPRPKYRLDCYAIYPASGHHFDTDNKRIDYNTTAVDGNTDVLYATFTGQREQRDNSEKSRTVSLTFRHIFSQVQFKAASSLNVQVTELQLCNIYSRGIFNIGDLTNGTTPAWQSHDGITTYNIDMATTAATLTSTPTLLNPTDKVLMLIPQQRTAWNPAANTGGTTIDTNDSGTKGTYLKIRCTVQMGNTKLVDNDYIYYPIDINWTAGKSYVYTLTFGTGYDASGNKTQMDMILSTEVHDWEDSGNNETNPSEIYI